MKRVQIFAITASVLGVAAAGLASPTQASASEPSEFSPQTSAGPCLPWHGNDYMRVGFDGSSSGLTYCLGGAGTTNYRFNGVYRFSSGNNQGSVTWCDGYWTPFDKWVTWTGSKLKDNCISKIVIR
ncbi:hypothetical protein [Kribbella sp. NPDC003557]|uniref:hypothetical protein n=1 Tax=Kribbella sp. NPDC003557 TaxID=3154449 RepID=UPI0033A1FD0D